MTQLSPSRPIHRLRVFSACLLSLLMIAAPMTPLAASAHSTATASSEKQAERKLANLAKKQLSPGEALDRSYVVGAPPAGAVTATLSDSFVDTAPADGMADPGSIVTYTATITNSTGADITGVNFTDTISPYTTLILGSIKISPRAIADSYNATQNTVLDTAASSLPTVLANDTGTPAPTVSGVVGCADVTAPFTCNTTQAGGSVTLNTNGSFTYTPPSGFTGTDDFTYNATNGISPDDTAKVTINVTPPCPTITVTNPATTSGPAGTPFSQTFTQTGGVGTTNFTLNSGTLPTGLTLHSGTGVLDGTPTQGGTFPITVKATDSNACTGIGPTYNLTITCQTITVTNPGVNTGTVNAAFSQTFTQSGGIGTITWSETGALPTGITLNTSTGVLSGTPTQSGSFPITVTATDGNGCTGTGSTYTLTINCQTITVTKPVTATGTVDTAFSQNFTQTGAQGTATFTTASTLPAGLTLATNGTLSGTPTEKGSFPIVVTVTDSNSCTGTSSTYTLVIGCQTITVTNPATTSGTVNTPFSQNFTQTGAHGTATFTTASTLPAGLSLATNGTLSGTPTQTGSFPIVVTVTDSNGCTGTGSTYTLVIGCQSITVTNPATNTGTAGTAFSQTFTQSGGVGTITWSKTGTLPTGITLNSSSGLLSGTTSQVGSFPITVTATDQNGCPGSGATYNLTISCQSITVTNPGVNSVQAGVAFDQAFTATGILGTATWSETGALPAGITLNSSTGHLAGTSNAVGSYPITVKATDTNGCFGTSSYTLTITCPTITVARNGGGSFPAATINAAYPGGNSVIASGGTGSYTFAYNGGTPPPGINLASNGVLSGTPTATGTFTFTVTATDGGTGCTGSQSFTIVVNPGVTNDSYSNLVNNTEAVVTGGSTTSPTTPFVSLSGTLVANDAPSGGVTITSTGTFSTTQGGSVIIASDGTFKYTPPVTVSPLSSDTFTYTASSNSGAGSTGPSSATGTVTLNLSNRVWYVKNNGSNGNGQSQSPFNTLAAAQTASTASDIIFVYNGDGTTTGQSTGITLKSNQQLIGEGVALVVNSNTLVAAGTKPQITNTTAASDAVTLNDGNTVKGLTITGAARDGISSVVTHAGFTADTLTVQSNTNVGIDLISMTGTVTITNSTISTAGSQALTINNGTAVVTVNNTNTINGGTGTAVAVLNRPLSAGAIAIGATVNNGQIQLLSNTSGTISFTGSQTLSNTTVNGVTMTTNTGATINFSGTLNVTTTTGVPFQASGGGTLNVTGTANLTSGAATNGLSLNGMTIGGSGVAFSSVSTTGATTGINLVNDSNTVSVNGGTITNGTTGISLQGSLTALSLAGMTITGPTTGITNTTNFGAITIGASVNVSGTTALNLTTGNLNGTFANLSSTGGTNGVLLNSIGGSGWAATAGTLAGSTGAAFKVDGGSANMTYGGNITSTGFLVDIGATTGRSGGTIAFSGTLGGAGALAGTGIRIQNSTGTSAFTFSGTQTLGTSGSRMGSTAVNLNANNTTTTFNFNGTLSVFTGAFTAFTATGPTGGTINFSGTDSIDSTGQALVLNGMNLGSGTLSNVTSSGGVNGISLTNVTGGTLAVSAGSLSGNSGSTFLVSGGTATFTYNGTMSQSNAQKIVNISGITGGTITLGGGITGSTSCTGITLAGSAGTITFSGGISLNGTADTFTASNGSGPGFTLNVTGTNDIGATTKPTGPALNITNTTIGASNVTFRSIGANGGTNGIVLSGTGSTGGLTISGNGGSCTSAATCTGGAIQNTTGRGISLTNTQKVSIDRIFVSNTVNSGIGGTQVVDFTLTNSRLDANGNTTGNDFSNVGFGIDNLTTENNLSGVVVITGNNLTNSFEHGIDIQNFAGTISNATISNNTITSSISSATSHGSGIRLLGFGNASTTSNITKATISGNTIMNFPGGAGITSQVGNNTSGPAGAWGTVGSATNRIFIQNNIIQGQTAANPMNTNAILMTLTGKGQANWLADSNGTVGQPITNIGGTEIGVTVRGVNPTATCDITNNRIVGITSVNAQAIAFAADFLTLTTDAPTLSGIISGNNISGQDGEAIQALATPGSSAHVDVSIKNNTTTAPNCAGCNRFGITAQVGTSSATTTGSPSMCLDMSGNTAAGSGVNSGIGIRKKTAAYVFNIEGFAGGGDPTAYLTGLNPAGGGVIMISQTTGFGNCATAPLRAAPGGVEAMPSQCRKTMDTSTDTDTPSGLLNGILAVGSPDARVANPTVDNRLSSNFGNISQNDLDFVVAAAIQRWTSAGLTLDQVATLRSIKFDVADLSGDYLGESGRQHVLLDRTAGGKGWYIGSDSSSDSLFSRAVSTTRRYTDPLSAPAGHLDLLTAIEHEMGHKLGLPDTYADRDRDNLMYGYLTVGERRLPASGQARNAKPGNQFAQHLKLRSISAVSLPTTMVTRRSDKPITPLSGETVNVNIGTLPAGKSVTITFQVQLNASMPFGTSSVTTQGTVTYTAGPGPIANGEAGSSDLSPDVTLLTDDPGIGTNAPGETDPTVTPVDAPTASGSSVSGQILDANGNPVEGAAVRLTGDQNRLTVTDAAGFYHFDDVETNGFYTVVPARSNFSFSPSQKAFSQLGQHTDAGFVANATGTSLNPLDTTEYFVRQQYVDFLGREPDEAGLGFWVTNIESCGNDAQCRAGKRIDTSAAFFLSIEFQKTGYLVYRTYQAAFGDLPGAPVPVRLGNFKSDQAMIARDVIVNGTGWETKLNDNEAAFMADFVSRATFTAAYPTSLSPDAFVGQLFAHAGVTPADGDRTAAVNEFGSATDTANAAARGRALQRVAENATLQQQEFNQAFVLMQYFGYLRRDANSAPDTDFSGYSFWLNKLNTFGGNYQQAEMVKAFLVASEYRGRFPK